MSAELDTWANRIQRAPDPLALVVDQPKGYTAWGQDHTAAAMLDFRLKSDVDGEEVGELLPLHYLMRVSYTGNKIAGDIVSFAFADCIILVRGFHLGELRAAVKSNRVDYLQEFDPDRWEQPAGGVPIIERIEVTKAGAGNISRS